MLHVDLETLQRNGQQAIGRLVRDTCLHPDTARRLSCDASLVTVLKDNQEHVLNIGRRSRIVSPHIRRALHRGEFSADHNHVFRDRSGKLLPTVFTPAYAGLTVQKLIKSDSHETSSSSWSAEAMDYDIAVSALLAIEQMKEMNERATDTA